jgi:hypothetical protein
VPEPGPVPAVDVHVASESLRGPELPLAEAAGVRSRRPREAPREAAAVAPWLLRLPRAPGLHRAALLNLLASLAEVEVEVRGLDKWNEVALGICTG